MRTYRTLIAGLFGAALVMASAWDLNGAQRQPRTFAKHVLAWADVRNGYQHDSISHAVATIERLGRESGEFDTTIRTDSQPITKQPITFRTGTGIATGEQFVARMVEDARPRARFFYSTLGHAPESWDDPVIQGLYVQALRWALRLVDGDATPRPRK